MRPGGRCGESSESFEARWDLTKLGFDFDSESTYTLSISTLGDATSTSV